MFRTISNFMRVAEIRRKILFTLAMLIVFRIGTFIPVPFTNGDVLKAQDQLNALGILNTFGGMPLKTSPSSRWNHAVYYSIHHRAIIADGCCS